MIASGPKAAEYIARTNGLWALYLSTGDVLQPSAPDSPVPFLTMKERLDLTLNGWMILLSDTEAKIMTLFHQAVGDDGPTRDNPYKGKARVYAYVTGPSGGITENT
jgi:hypothetical protein